MTRALVYGLAVAGAATARALVARNVDVVAIDDDLGPERRALADDLGIDLVEDPTDTALRDLVGSVDMVCPSPGVPETHAVIGAAQERNTEVVSEIELAYRWEQDRPGGPRPMIAVTGTDGKTTTTLLVAEMLRAAGRSTVDAGNTSTPLVTAIDQDVDSFVVECTSFRLAGTTHFRADAAGWLNLAPDHLNWHRSMASYEAAKGRIFAAQRSDDVSVGFIDDEIVMRHVRASRARQVAFGLDQGDYFCADRMLVGPRGSIATLTDMRRALPHDITNALCAAALVLESGLADEPAIRSALRTFVGPPHRLESVGRWHGVEWFNDSKATTPHAARAAIGAFDSVVLIAGGYDKGVDLGAMFTEPDRLRAVVATGQTGPAIAAVLPDTTKVTVAAGLDDAVEAAAAEAGEGDVVLLSPGCASFDQYDGFEARGDHFRRLVRELHATRDRSDDQHQPRLDPPPLAGDAP